MKRGLGLIALVSLMATGIVADRADAATPITFNVTIGAPLSYVFNGGANDQVLGLVPGKSYQFIMSAADAAAHPFFIATTTGVEPPTPFVDPGLTGNGTANIMFTVPTTPIPQLFYQCSVHSFMTNKIVLNATAVPALDATAVAALGVLLLSVGVAAILWQRRKRTATPAV
jgi:hypothetical protein